MIRRRTRAITTFEQFVGQTKLKEMLKIMINSAKKRQTMPDHVLLSGPAGMGKTTLANLIASLIGGRIIYAQGPLLVKPADILTLLNNVEKETIIFIDEIHGINKKVEELLYSALDAFYVDILIGPEGEKKLLRMQLPPFMMIGATTKMHQLNRALRERFGFSGQLLVYSQLEIAQIALAEANTLKIDLTLENALMISEYSNLNPRQALKIIDRLFDYLVVHESTLIDRVLMLKMFDLVGIYQYGMDVQHLNYLKLLTVHFPHQSVALSVITTLLKTDATHLKQLIEPILLENHLIEKSSKGRRVTLKGRQFLKKEAIK